ncbi:hypothetical protein HQN87_22580 [Paenibacillus tritici]|uniref:Uncharacterized protein n=1 Tax=Paenibacillus tritici TaxID=1873425 RepID=A0ABX2DUN6_9BACL|nr:hypothetical protein [Paenibacillus tritici]
MGKVVAIRVVWTAEVLTLSTSIHPQGDFIPAPLDPAPLSSPVLRLSYPVLELSR